MKWTTIGELCLYRLLYKPSEPFPTWQRACAAYEAHFFPAQLRCRREKGGGALSLLLFPVSAGTYGEAV